MKCSPSNLLYKHHTGVLHWNRKIKVRFRSFIHIHNITNAKAKHTLSHYYYYSVNRLLLHHFDDFISREVSCWATTFSCLSFCQLCSHHWVQKTSSFTSICEMCNMTQYPLTWTKCTRGQHLKCKEMFVFVRIVSELPIHPLRLLFAYIWCTAYSVNLRESQGEHANSTWMPGQDKCVEM